MVNTLALESRGRGFKSRSRQFLEFHLCSFISFFHWFQFICVIYIYITHDYFLKIANIRGNACTLITSLLLFFFPKKKCNDNKGHFNKCVDLNSIICYCFVFHGFYFINFFFNNCSKEQILPRNFLSLRKAKDFWITVPFV